MRIWTLKNKKKIKNWIQKIIKIHHLIDLDNRMMVVIAIRKKNIFKANHKKLYIDIFKTYLLMIILKLRQIFFSLVHFGMDSRHL